MDHTVVHFDIPADDPERALRFYRELFDWTFSRWENPHDNPAEGGGAEYWLISTVPTDGLGHPTRPGINGGLYRRKQAEQGPRHYIGVQSVAGALMRVEGLGGQVVLPKMPIPGVGWYAFVRDTEGNLFGLFESDPDAL